MLVPGHGKKRTESGKGEKEKRRERKKSENKIWVLGRGR
jgi:hypothetical protein